MIHIYVRKRSIDRTYTGRHIGLVDVLRRHFILIVIIVLSVWHALGKVEESAVRAVRCGGQIIGQVRETGIRRATPMPQAVMLIVAITTRPGLRGPATTRGLTLRAVTVYPGHVVTWKQV